MIRDVVQSVNMKFLNKKIQNWFPYISSASLLPGASLLLDPLLGVTLTLGNWTVPFSI